jgi:hypothetical protein
LAFAASGAYAQDSQIVQAFACNLEDGKTNADVMALADAYRKAWPEMNQQDPMAGAFVWTSFREGSPYDYIVGFLNSDQKTMVAGLESYYASGGAELDAQFAATGDCDATIMFTEQIRDGGGVPDVAGDGPDAVVETFSCKLNPGSDFGDIEAAEAYWRKQLTEIGSEGHKNFEAFRWTPYRGGTGQSDFFWVGNSPDLATWAQGEMDYLGSKQGQAAEARFAKSSTCVSGMWSGYWIVAPTAGPTAE